MVDIDDVDRDISVKRNEKKIEAYFRELADIEKKLREGNIPQGKREKLEFRRDYLQKVLIPMLRY